MYFPSIFNDLIICTSTSETRVIATLTQIHGCHHFDTRKRLHPLMHPLNTGDASPSIRALDQATLHFMKDCRVVFSFMKKEISTRQGQYLFLLIIIHLSSIKSANWKLSSFILRSQKIPLLPFFLNAVKYHQLG